MEEYGQHLVKLSWSLEARGLARVELEKNGARAHRLDIAGAIPGEGKGTHQIVPGGGLAPGRGSKEGNGGLDGLSDGDEEPWVEVADQNND